MIKLSTIIPIYNKEKALRNTLQSIVDNHEIPDDEYECILIDDESTDSCPNICKEFCQKYSYFKYFRIFNDGLHWPSNARNIGLDIAKGTFVHFLDADDLLLKTFYKDAIDNMITYRNNIFIRSYVITKNGEKASFYTTDLDLHGSWLGNVIFNKQIIENIKFEYVCAEDFIFTAIAFMNNDCKFYDDRKNYNSFVQNKDYSELSDTADKKFGVDHNYWKEYIVSKLQHYEKYPYKIENNKIVQKKYK